MFEIFLMRKKDFTCKNSPTALSIAHFAHLIKQTAKNNLFYLKKNFFQKKTKKPLHQTQCCQ